VFDQVSQSKGRANHVFRAIIAQEQICRDFSNIL
jgi:hypothetical protein